MRMNCKYVPMLRAKQGELFALKRLDPLIKSAVLPVVDIDEAPPSRKKTLDVHLEGIVKRLCQSWGKEHQIIIDSDRIDSDYTLSNGKHYMQYLSELVAQWGLKAILTCSLDRTDQFVTEVKKDMLRSNGSLCIRLFSQDIQQSTNVLSSKLHNLLQKIGTKRSSVDLIIDLGVVDKEHFNEMLDSVCKFLNIEECVSDWNSIILTCSSFPNSLKGIKADTVIEIPRVDYQLWEAIPSSRLSPKRIPIFGDYGIVSALYSDQPDFRSANIPTKIRYALDDRWLVFKGATTKKHGFEYFRKLSKAVMKLEDYKGEDFSWGDKFISDCATGKGKTGNMASWVCADTTHHITHVVNQLSN